ncbi:hypothetical protein KOR42_25360 [Thalassoglobus neptunius]|uniref:DUF1501 domain-containing protein n=1 Tax=Thalassoglobus neptunius TaxID=1938619 RepID=A0A5C5X7P7_9PLAN|nr:DUF1501 domain-containing protein [Thalassoglobus neptunius]TWT59147.1 hypothetical protein KOR42_25360 [Thalassoglobus neptunius]
MSAKRNCEGTSRRDCLKFGLGGMLGTGLVESLRRRGNASESLSAPRPQADRCILIWMDGGPTHFETFDPKPTAPSEYRGDFTHTKTAVPGTVFSEHMTKLAATLGDYAMIRSIRHDQGNHGAGNHYMMTGAPPRIPVGCGAYVSFHPSMGSVVAKKLGKDNGLPAYFSMPRMSRSGGPNFLGARFAPFVVADDPNRDNFRVRDVAIPKSLAEERFQGRTDLRSKIDQMLRLNDEASGDPVAAFDEYYRQGFDLVTSPDAQQAFDIEREDPETRDRYGRDSFGQRCLLARRLVEAGVPFITVYDGGWDHHSNIFGALRKRLPNWDNSVATLIQDLKERGLLDTTLVVALGEFGRTPKISTLSGQTTPGRDHWANAMSVLMAGGGTPGGAVIGATDRKGFSAVDRVLFPENFVSTIYTKLGINPDEMLYTPQGRPTHLVSDPTPISELIA